MSRNLTESLARLLRAARHFLFGTGSSRTYHFLRRASFRALYLLSGGKGRMVHVAGVYPLFVEWERVAIDFDHMEAGFTLPFAQAITEGMTVFDVGASIGEWSALAATRSKGVKVHVFEPNGPSWTSIRKIFDLNGLGMPAGLFKGFLSETDNLTEELLAETKDPRWPELETGNAEFEDIRRSQNIPSISLDTYCRSTGVVPDIVKIDVEGAEGLVMRGAKKIFRSRRPIVFVSLHPWLLPAFGDTPEGIRKILSDLDYEWTMLSVDHEEHWLATPGIPKKTR